MMVIQEVIKEKPLHITSVLIQKDFRRHDDCIPKLRVRPVRKGDFESIVETDLTNVPYVKIKPANFERYLNVIRGIGGEILVVEEEGEIVGEAEMVPQPDLSVAGPHVFLVNLTSRENDRTIKRELLRACKRVAKSWGFSFLDHIPSPGDLEDLKMLGFTVTTAKQVLLKVRPKKIANLAKIEEETPKKYPSNLALLSGEIRPGKLSWALALGEQPFIPTKAYRIRVGRFDFISLLSNEGGKLHLSLFGVPASGPGEIFNALGATLTMADSLGAREIRTLAWARYLCSFESAEFEATSQVPLLRMRVD